MKAFTISTTLALFFAAVYGAPSTPKPEKRVFDVSIIFNGADADANFTQEFPADDQSYPITNPLSVTSITSIGGGFCTFTGIDGSSTVVFGEETVTVAPPQAQVSGVCDTD